MRAAGEGHGAGRGRFSRAREKRPRPVASQAPGAEPPACALGLPSSALAFSTAAAALAP